MCRGVSTFNNIEQTASVEPAPEWPIGRGENILVACCRSCNYPIARGQNVMLLLVDSIVMSIVIDQRNLITEDFAGVVGRVFDFTWQKGVFCFGCGSQLSFTERDVPENIRSARFEDDNVLLNLRKVAVGNNLVMRARYEQ